jgi:hypothetical protein
MPNCGRCAKRNKPDQCVYHPAPLTKAASPQDVNSDQSSPRVNSFSTAYQSSSDREVIYEASYPVAKRVKRTESAQPVLNLVGLPVQPESYTVEEISKPVSHDSTQANTLSFDNSAGFINHSAVLAEYELSIGIQPPNTDGASTPKISQAYIDRGAAVLTLLRDFSAIEKYIDK